MASRRILKKNINYICSELLAECEDGEATTRTVRLSKEKLERFREKFPAWMDEDEFQLIIHHS